MKNRVLHIWIYIWVIVFLVGTQADCVAVLGNKGILLIRNEYYRFLTGLFVHANVIHVLANVITLYFVGRLLSGYISDNKLVLFSMSTGIITSILFSVIYPKSVSIGGSPVIFSLIGLCFIMQIKRKNFPKFHLGNMQNNWIICYLILSNIPFFSGNASTLVCHLLAVSIGMILAYLVYPFM